MNEKGMTIIKEFEGLRLSSYLCPAGYLTIGYGHRITPDDPQRITFEQARALLIQDVRYVEKSILPLLKSPTNENHLAAFISFSYNVGVEAFAKSTLLRVHNQGLYEAATLQFSRWIYATIKGQRTPLDGLIRRRKAEAALYSASILPPRKTVTSKTGQSLGQNTSKRPAPLPV
jgi:lysozyme